MNKRIFVKKVRGIIFIAFLILILGFSLNTSKSNNDSETIVKINNKIIKKLPKNQSFIGANWSDDMDITRCMFNNEQYLSEYVRTLKDLGINIFRNPGGVPMATLFWIFLIKKVWKL